MLRLCCALCVGGCCAAARNRSRTKADTLSSGHPDACIRANSRHALQDCVTEWLLGLETLCNKTTRQGCVNGFRSSSASGGSKRL